MKKRYIIAGVKIDIEVTESFIAFKSVDPEWSFTDSPNSNEEAILVKKQ